MTRFSSPVNNFNAGELSPRLYGRFDIPKYAAGCEILRNFLVLPEGGIRKRSGTRFVKGVVDDANLSRLIPFIFSTAQAYVLEFANDRIRVFTNEGIVLQEARTFLDAAVDTLTEEVEITDHGYRDTQGPVGFTTTGVLPVTVPILDAPATFFIKTAQTLTFTDAEVANATNDITFATAHGLTPQMGPYRITVTATDTAGVARVPTGWNSATDYYIIVSSPTVIQLSLTPGGAAVAITSDGEGSMSLTPDADYVRDKFRLSSNAGGPAITFTGVPAGGGTHTMTPVAVDVEIPSPYVSADLPDIHYIQSADVLYLFHPNHPNYKIGRMGNAQWSIDKVDWLDGPFIPENSTATTILPSATTLGAVVTLTASALTGLNGGVGWRETDLGRLFRLSDGTSVGWGVIVGIRTALVAEGEVRATLPAPATPGWSLGSWFGPDNYARDGSFGEQRLWAGGEKDTPNTIHASRTALFEDFGTTETDLSVLDDNALDFQIAADQVNAITNIITKRNVLVLTRGGYYPVQASSNNEAVNPTNVNIPEASARGVSRTQAISVGRHVIFASRNGQRVKALRYAFEIDSYDEDDLTLIARHVTEGSVADLQFADEPDATVWMRTATGRLWGCTYVPEQEVFAWHRHVLGGSFQGDDVVVESIATIPSQAEDHDQLWVIAKRTVNNVTVRQIEFMEEPFEFKDIEDSFFVDSGLSLDGALTTDPASIIAAARSNPLLISSPGHGYVTGDEIRITHVLGMTELNGNRYKVTNETINDYELTDLDDVAIDGTGYKAYASGGETRKATNAITGLTHLVGETVTICVDGATHPTRVVDGAGAITLDSNYTEVSVGLGYNADALSLVLQRQDRLGNSHGKMTGIEEVTMRFVDTAGIQIGPSLEELDEVDIFRLPSDPMSGPVRLKTGDEALDFSGDFATEARVAIRQPHPLPATIVAMSAHGEGSER